MNIQFNTGNLNLRHSPVKDFKPQAKTNTAGLINFKGKADTSKSLLDKILTNKYSEKLFKLADLNPFAFNVGALLTTCVIMRPPTILALPGGNKEDKQYAAGKSVISALIANTSRLIFILPLGLMMKNLGHKAKKDPSFKFPKIETRRFEAFNYLINNGSALLLSVPVSAFMVVAVTKVMNKIMPKKESNIQKKKA